jgi:hypothetical protein
MVLWLLAATAAAEPLQIEHQPVRCLVAEKYPQLDACIVPRANVARARVYFRGGVQGDWYYVEMKPEAGCFRGTLPRPRESLKEMEYYVAATGTDFDSVQTEEYVTEVVRDEKSCHGGTVAPFVSSASVVVGSLAGAAVPAGFAVGGAAVGLGTVAVVGAGVAGAAGAAVVAGGGEPATTTTTTLVRHPTTTTTTTTTSTTTSTTTMPSCAADSAVPDVRFRKPGNNDDVGATVEIEVEASDPGPVSSGIREVRIYAEEQGGSRNPRIATLPGPGPIFQVAWTVPPCQGPQDRWYLNAEAVDGCDRTAVDRIRVRRRSASCTSPAAGPSAGAEGLAWTSELSVAGGRGQVVASDSSVRFVGGGRTDGLLRLRRGRNRVEATLVEGRGAGTWAFTFGGGRVVAGSLRVVAGEALTVAADTVTFRLQGRPGERLVFTFDVP